MGKDELSHEKDHVGKARDAIVAMLNVMTPGDGALLWETLHSSALVEEAFGIEKPSPAEEKYLLVLAETYKNASGWDTRRQILSVMADIVPLKRLQQYLPMSRNTASRLHEATG